MSSRSSVQALETGGASKASNSKSSKLNVLLDMNGLGLMMISLIYSVTTNTNPNTIALLCYGVGGIFILAHVVQSYVHQYVLLLEVSELKAELQKMSSAVPQEKEAQGPCKVKCFQVEEEPKSPQLLNSTKKVQITNTQVEQTKSVGKESVGRKSDGKGNKKAGVQQLSEKDKSLWNRCLRVADEKGFKNDNCGAQKFRTFYVGNLSFKAKSSDIQQAFEKLLSMKVDSVMIARDSTGKSRGCAFVTMRWREFHVRNPGYIRCKDPCTQDDKWSRILTYIMDQQSICGRQIYVEVACSQRRD